MACSDDDLVDLSVPALHAQSARPLASPDSSVAHRSPASGQVRCKVLFHPFFTLRTGGLPSTAIDELTDGSTAGLLARLETCLAEVRSLAPLVGKGIEKAFRDFAATAEKREANAVLGLKRDVFNLRRLDPAATALIRPWLTPDQADGLLRMQAILDGDEVSEAWRQAHERELLAAHGGFRKLLTDGNLDAALQMNNPALRERLRRFLDAPPPDRLSKATNGLRCALLNYALRASQKVSPLSSLGIVSVQRWAAASACGTTSRTALTLAGGVPESRVEIRHAPVQQLLRRLFTTYEALSRTAPLRLNPTLRQQGNDLRWRRIAGEDDPSERIHGARETAVSLESTTATRLLQSSFATSTTSCLSLDALEARLRDSLPPRLHARVSGIVGDALRHGLLVFAGEPPEQCHLDEWLEAVLPGLHAEAGHAALRRAVDQLNGAVRALRQAPRDDKAVHLHAIDAAFDALARTTDSPVRAPSVQPLVHEDCFHTGSPSLSLADLGPTRSDLATLVAALPILASPYSYGLMADIVASRFLARFGADGRCRDPIEFLEGCAEDLRLQAPAKAGSRFDPSGFTAPTAALNELHEEFMESLAERARMASTIEIDSASLDDMLARIHPSIRARRRSHCINGQFLPHTDGSRRFVVNQIYPGHSRMLSRFLPHDEAASADVAAYLRAASPASRCAAIPGVFGFNANLHPPCAALELDIPPYGRGHAGLERVPLAECELRHDARTGQVRLYSPDGRALDAIYFGIQMPARLPRVHRMLNALVASSDAVIPIWRTLAPRLIADEERVVVLPRLTLGTLVLSRRVWHVPASLFPASSLSDADFFQALQRWRREHGLPAEVFYQHARFESRAAPTTDAHALRDRALAMRKSVKPMHLRFADPVAVAGLRRSGLLGSDLVLTEALPSSQETIASVGGMAHVCELSIELSTMTE